MLLERLLLSIENDKLLFLVSIGLEEFSVVLLGHLVGLDLELDDSLIESLLSLGEII